MATCVDLGETQYPEVVDGNGIFPMQGQSLRPLLTGNGTFADRPLHWEHEGNAAIRVGSRKLVRQGARGDWELFDLSSDRTEQHNLAEAHPDEARALAQQWRSWARRSNVLPKPPRKSKQAADADGAKSERRSISR